MKKLFVLLFLAPSAFALPADKLNHFTACYAVSLTGAVATRETSDFPELIGFALGLSVGLLKEISDKEFSHGDFAADFLGAATGSILHYAVRF